MLAASTGAVTLPSAQRCIDLYLSCCLASQAGGFDLLRAVCALACCVTKWDPDCDRRLHRLMCYLYSTRHHRMVGYICQDDAIDSLESVLYCDADFAGCSETLRSTNGVHFDIAGPGSKFPITGVSKKQTAVSHSTPEAWTSATKPIRRIV